MKIRVHALSTNVKNVPGKIKNVKKRKNVARIKKTLKNVE